MGGRRVLITMRDDRRFEGNHWCPGEQRSPDTRLHHQNPASFSLRKHCRGSGGLILLLTRPRASAACLPWPFRALPRETHGELLLLGEILSGFLE